jgi:hypothetical protein
MELNTRLNGTSVRVVYTVETEEVDCFDSASGREYTQTVANVYVESVFYKGIDIQEVVSDSDMTEMEMECQFALEEVEA